MLELPEIINEAQMTKDTVMQNNLIVEMVYNTAIIEVYACDVKKKNKTENDR